MRHDESGYSGNDVCVSRCDSRPFITLTFKRVVLRRLRYRTSQHALLVFNLGQLSGASQCSWMEQANGERPVSANAELQVSTSVRKQELAPVGPAVSG